LQIHGTSDATISYTGGSISGAQYPGAVRTVETWATYDGCSLTPDLSAPPVDVADNIPGAESTVRRYADGCALGGSTELWTTPGGPHSPPLGQGFRNGLVGFLLDHPKAGVKFTDPQTLTWPPIRWASEYRVYRGELADLFDGNGDGIADFGYGDCASGADPDPTDTTLSVADVPPLGEGFYYVVGFVGGLGAESVLGTTSNGWGRLPGLSCP
jgi:hypothetical protein